VNLKMDHKTSYNIDLINNDAMFLFKDFVK
jgi:hypothetical protein